MILNYHYERVIVNGTVAITIVDHRNGGGTKVYRQCVRVVVRVSSEQ